MPSHGGGRPRVVDRERGGRAGQARHQARQLVLSVNSEGGSARRTRHRVRRQPARDRLRRRYLLDITGQLEGDVACFKLADPGSPTMVNDPADEARSTFLMPMRV